MNEVINQVLSGIESGVVTPEEVERLEKAITAGYGYAGKPTDLSYGGVIQSESLEATLKSVTFDMKNLKLWPSISMDKANNLFEQYNRLTSYGSDSSPYIGEGGAPQEEDSSYVRDGQRIVFFGTRRKVSHQMTLVKTSVGDVVNQQAKEGTMHILKHIERELYWGHAHFVDAAGQQTGSQADLPSNSIAMNGLLEQLLKGDTDEQMRSGDFEGFGAFQSIVKELDGSVITQDDFEELAVITLENFGSPTEVHMEPISISAFVRTFYPQFRSEPGLASQTVGYDVNKVTTTAGKMDLKPNLFLRPRSVAKPKPVNNNAPAISGLSVAATANTNVNSTIPAGNYWYRVTFVSDFGESAPVDIASAVTVAAGQDVTLAVSGSIPAGVKFMRVYRTAAGGALATAKFIGNYKLGGTIRDINTKLPGLGEGFMLDMSAENMRFKQLMPLSKLNFAIVTTALEFAIVLYGALFVYTPRFNGVFRNVGH